MRSTVWDVMTTDVAAVNHNASFHTVAELLIDKGVSGLPVLDDDNHVVGVVSEADLLAKEEFKERYYGDDYRPPLRARIRHTAGSEGSGLRKSLGQTAGELMSTPAHVTDADAPVVTAARLMDRYGIKRLPVTDPDGHLIGIVTRRDLIKVFLRPDHNIEQDVREAIRTDLHTIDVTVADGIVTLTGTLAEHSQAITAIRLAENIDGVVAIRATLGWKHDDIADLPVWGGA
ncbi:CBS domain-containing protein [Nonomuraea rosea]|uniref:CBS domain-containing protein n=1 Tax=Nonomuraea rosea TaxID=638574 RepID=A0ABP6X558_9ACTN